MPTRPIPDDPTATSDTNHGDLLPLLLEICEDFLAHTGPATHHEIDIHLRAHGITGGPGWLIDMLGLTRLRLQNATHRDEQGAHHDT
ncbi:hypothetical protein ACWEEK_23980 [Micromonospora aurantiaca (nom. illeg.)]